MNILIVNGPNLNLLGLREPEIYGKGTYAELCARIRGHAESVGISVDVRQTNHEGTIIDWLQEEWPKLDGIILNPGALTHYSYALRDTVAAIPVPVVEVHLSDIASREPFRRVSVIRDVCAAQIAGKGFEGYVEALDWLRNRKG